jgi:DNA-binding NtrC family response regulator
MERVQTAEEMRAALDKQEWDVIVADYVMPRFDAPAALRLLEANGRDVPFILVSGTIGENTAVAMMKAGAHDYVMKDNLARLAPAVKREVGDAEMRRKRRRAEEALRQSEERYRALYEDNPSMYFTMDGEGTVLSVNLFGAHSSVTLWRNWWDNQS